MPFSPDDADRILARFGVEKIHTTKKAREYWLDGLPLARRAMLIPKERTEWVTVYINRQSQTQEWFPVGESDRNFAGIDVGYRYILGHRGIGGDWVYHVTATALEDTTLLFIPRKTFEILAKTNAEFSYKMMTLFAEELKHAEEKTLHLPVINRVANAILMNYNAFGADAKTGELYYTLSRQDFANRAITTYESTVRAIAELKSEKIIDTDNKTIFIKNLKKLQQVASAK